MNSASLCSLAGRYDNPIPTLFLAQIDCFKIPALYTLPLLDALSWDVSAMRKLQLSSDREYKPSIALRKAYSNKIIRP